MTSSPRLVRAAAAATVVGVLLSGCSGSAGPSNAAKSRTAAGATTSTSLTQPAPAASSGSQTAPANVASTAVAPSVHVQRRLARNMNVPWGIAFLPNGNALVSSRDRARIIRVKATGGKKRIGTVPGVVSNGASGGEGGLLGLALSPHFTTNHWLYAFMSTASDNRVVRMKYRHGDLGKKHLVRKGIPHGLHHNGGGIAFGPDGRLYVTTGEGGVGSRAQNKKSLGGKILRMTAKGHAPSDNPFNNLVYSYGHRNVEGLAWDSAGRLWATEFGDKGWDELNLIRPGHNYGWPATEGRTSNPAYTSPKAQWHTFNAGPAGIAIINDVAWIGGLTGHRLLRVKLDGASVASKGKFLVGRYGRLRGAAAAPDGTLWLTTSNTDHRATPARHDDRIFRLKVS